MQSLSKNLQLISLLCKSEPVVDSYKVGKSPVEPWRVQITKAFSAVVRS